MDSPWRRLPWTLPAALLIWAAALWGLAYFMEKPTYRPVAPPPIDAQLIEVPAPVATETIQPEPPAAVEKPKPPPPVMPQQVPVKPKVSPRIEQNPAAQKAKVITNAVDAPGNAASAPVEAGPGRGEHLLEQRRPGRAHMTRRARLGVTCTRTAEPGQLSNQCRKFRKTCGRKRSNPLRWRASILPSTAAQRWNSPNRLRIRVLTGYCWIASRSGGLCRR